MSEDLNLYLSLAQLDELQERASSHNYMLVQADDGTWIRVHPYFGEFTEDDA